MNNNKNLGNIASTSTKRKRLVIMSDSDIDSDCEEIVCPVRNRRRIIVSDSEKKKVTVQIVKLILHLMNSYGKRRKMKAKFGSTHGFLE